MKPPAFKPRQLELFGRKIEADQYRRALLARLDSEGADDLAARLRKCGLAFKLYCRECSATHEVETKCNRKWCPSCAPKRANERAAKLRAAVLQMHWPMHITLTCRNVPLEDAPRSIIRDLMKSFRTLRRSKLWTTNVSGGVVSVEITDKGKGLHPHLHTLIDCRWLALRTPQPHRDDSPEQLKTKFRCAAEELSGAWAKALGQETPPSVHIRRCNSGAAAEVLKYAMKSEDALACEGEIAPILRMLDACRTVATFGDLHGLKLPEDDRPALACPLGHTSWTTTPTEHTAWAELDNKAKLAALLRGKVWGL